MRRTRASAACQQGPGWPCSLEQLWRCWPHKFHSWAPAERALVFNWVQGQQTGFSVFNLRTQAIVKRQCIVTKQENNCLGTFRNEVFGFGLKRWKWKFRRETGSHYLPYDIQTWNLQFNDQRIVVCIMLKQEIIPNKRLSIDLFPLYHLFL